MAADWRVTMALAGGDRGIFEWLREHEVESDARRRLGGRIAVSGDDDRVFLYAHTEAAAREAERVVRELLSGRGIEASSAIDRWHPLEERWEEASVPLPATESDRERERAALEADEAQESAGSDTAEWEVRVELGSRADAEALEERLQGEGQSVIRRWNYVLVGANDEDEAAELAARLEREVPGATIHAEASGAAVWRALPPNPFAIFGGLGI